MIITVPPSWTAASGTTPWLRDRFHDSPFLNPLSIWAVLGKLHHHLPPVHQPPVQAINCLLRLVLILVPHEGKPSRVASPAVPGDVDVDDLAVLVEEREKVIGRRTEGDVEDEEGVGVADRRRAGAPEARHLAGAGAGGGAGGGAAVEERRGERIGGNDERRDVGGTRGWVGWPQEGADPSRAHTHAARRRVRGPNRSACFKAIDLDTRPDYYLKKENRPARSSFVCD